MKNIHITITIVPLTLYWGQPDTPTFSTKTVLWMNWNDRKLAKGFQGWIWAKLLLFLISIQFYYYYFHFGFFFLVILCFLLLFWLLKIAKRKTKNHQIHQGQFRRREFKRTYIHPLTNGQRNLKIDDTEVDLDLMEWLT